MPGPVWQGGGMPLIEEMPDSPAAPSPMRVLTGLLEHRSVAAVTTECRVHMSSPSEDLGFQIMCVRDGDPLPTGMWVDEVVPGGPFDRAGVPVPAMLEKVDGVAITGLDALRAALRGIQEEGKETFALEVRGTHSAGDVSGSHTPCVGPEKSYRVVKRDVHEDLGFFCCQVSDGPRRGVWYDETVLGGAFDRAGVSHGRICSLNGARVHDLQGLRRALGETARGALEVSVVVAPAAKKSPASASAPQRSPQPAAPQKSTQPSPQQHPLFAPGAEARNLARPLCRAPRTVTVQKEASDESLQVLCLEAGGRTFVQDVAPGGAGERCGVPQGRVEAVGGVAVSTVAELTTALQKMETQQRREFDLVVTPFADGEGSAPQFERCLTPPQLREARRKQCDGVYSVVVPEGDKLDVFASRLAAAPIQRTVTLDNPEESLGVSCVEKADPGSTCNGAWIEAVYPDTPAERAGLLPGRVAAVGLTPVAALSEFVAALAELRAAKTCTFPVTVYPVHRSGSPGSLAGEFAADAGPARVRTYVVTRVAPTDDLLQAEWCYDRVARCVRLGTTYTETPLGRAGVPEGEVVAIDGQPIRGAKDLRAAHAAAAGKECVHITVAGTARGSETDGLPLQAPANPLPTRPRAPQASRRDRPAAPQASPSRRLVGSAQEEGKMGQSGSGKSSDDERARRHPLARVEAPADPTASETISTAPGGAVRSSVPTTPELDVAAAPPHPAPEEQCCGPVVVAPPPPPPQRRCASPPQLPQVNVNHTAAHSAPIHYQPVPVSEGCAEKLVVTEETIGAVTAVGPPPPPSTPPAQRATPPPPLERGTRRMLSPVRPGRLHAAALPQPQPQPQPQLRSQSPWRLRQPQDAVPEAAAAPDTTQGRLAALESQLAALRLQHELSRSRSRSTSAAPPPFRLSGFPPDEDRDSGSPRPPVTVVFESERAAAVASEPSEDDVVLHHHDTVASFAAEAGEMRAALDRLSASLPREGSRASLTSEAPAGLPAADALFATAPSNDAAPVRPVRHGEAIRVRQRQAGSVCVAEPPVDSSIPLSHPSAAVKQPSSAPSSTPSVSIAAPLLGSAVSLSTGSESLAMPSVGSILTASTAAAADAYTASQLSTAPAVCLTKAPAGSTLTASTALADAYTASQASGTHRQLPDVVGAPLLDARVSAAIETLGDALRGETRVWEDGERDSHAAPEAVPWGVPSTRAKPATVRDAVDALGDLRHCVAQLSAAAPRAPGGAAAAATQTTPRRSPPLSPPVPSGRAVLPGSPITDQAPLGSACPVGGEWTTASVHAVVTELATAAGHPRGVFVHTGLVHPANVVALCEVAAEHLRQRARSDDAAERRLAALLRVLHGEHPPGSAGWDAADRAVDALQCRLRDAQAASSTCPAVVADAAACLRDAIAVPHLDPSTNYPRSLADVAEDITAAAKHVVAWREAAAAAAAVEDAVAALEAAVARAEDTVSDASDCASARPGDLAARVHAAADALARRTAMETTRLPQALRGPCTDLRAAVDAAAVADTQPVECLTGAVDAVGEAAALLRQQRRSQKESRWMSPPAAHDRDVSPTRLAASAVHDGPATAAMVDELRALREENATQRHALKVLRHKVRKKAATAAVVRADTPPQTAEASIDTAALLRFKMRVEESRRVDAASAPALPKRRVPLSELSNRREARATPSPKPSPHPPRVDNRSPHFPAVEAALAALRRAPPPSLFKSKTPTAPAPALGPDDTLASAVALLDGVAQTSGGPGVEVQLQTSSCLMESPARAGKDTALQTSFVGESPLKNTAALQTSFVTEESSPPKAAVCIQDTGLQTSCVGFADAGLQTSSAWRWAADEACVQTERTVSAASCGSWVTSDAPAAPIPATAPVSVPTTASEGRTASVDVPPTIQGVSVPATLASYAEGLTRPGLTAAALRRGGGQSLPERRARARSVGNTGAVRRPLRRASMPAKGGARGKVAVPVREYTSAPIGASPPLLPFPVPSRAAPLPPPTHEFLRYLDDTDLLEGGSASDLLDGLP